MTQRLVGWAEPGLARREPKSRTDTVRREGGGSWANHGFPHGQ
jgi:hypothetical protein